MNIYKASLIAVLAAATVLAYSPALRAQEKEKKDASKREGRGGGDFVKQRLDTLTTELTLTDAQKPKVEALLKDQSEKMRGLRDATPEERREKMQAARDEMGKKMKEILTAEQYEKYQKLPPPGRGQGGGKKKRDADAK